MRHTFHHPLALLVGLAALATAAVGCGDDDDGAPPPQPPARTPPPPTAGGERLQINADASGQLRYNTKALTAEAGTVTIVMTNPSPTPHDVAIEGGGVDEKGKVVPKGGTSRVSATLKAGTYTFYCSVPGHREGGMSGTLTVR